MPKNAKALGVALCACLWLGALSWAKAAPRVAGQFNPSDYPRDTIAKMMSREPCRAAGTYEIKDRLFSAELSYDGNVQETPPKHSELLRRWAQTLGDSSSASKYRNEISLEDGKKLHWVVVSDGLLPELKAQLQPRDRTLLYLVMIGCVDHEPLFAVDDFETDTTDPDEVYLAQADPLLPSLL